MEIKLFRDFNSPNIVWGFFENLFKHPVKAKLISEVIPENSFLSLKSVSVEEHVDESKKPFNLADIQVTLKETMGFSESYTLKLLESLYEKGFISYPRTSSNYLPLSQKDYIDYNLRYFLYRIESENQFSDSREFFKKDSDLDHPALFINLVDFGEFRNNNFFDLLDLIEKKANSLSNLSKEELSVLTLIAEQLKKALTLSLKIYNITISDNGVDYIFQLKTHMNCR